MSNLPDGCREGDPRAPWNEAARGECGTCSRFLEYGGCGVCELEFERAFGREAGTDGGHDLWRTACWALEWGISHLNDETREACPDWEEA